MLKMNCSSYMLLLISKNLRPFLIYLASILIYIDVLKFLFYLPYSRRCSIFFFSSHLGPILNFSANFVMGQPIVISFVFIAFPDHKNVRLALGISVYLPYSRIYSIFCFPQTSGTPVVEVCRFWLIMKKLVL